MILMMTKAMRMLMKAHEGLAEVGDDDDDDDDQDDDDDDDDGDDDDDDGDNDGNDDNVLLAMPCII